MTTTINASTSAGLISSADTSGILQLQTANTAALTIDASQNVGVGTASPVPYGGFKSLTLNGSTGGLIQLQSNGTSTGRFYAQSATNTVIDTLAGNLTVYATGSLFLGTGSATKATLDTSGNLGLGVTPSGSWGTQAFMLAKSGASNPTYPFIASTDSQAVFIGSNSYWDGTNWKAQFGGAGVVAMHQKFNYNAISWHTAPAVSTGNTQTFTQAMTLDASGNLGVGSTSPSTRLHIAGATTATSQLTTQHTGSAVTTVFGCDGGLDVGAVYVTTNHPLAFKTNNTERARITSGGYFKASDNGTYVGSTGAYHEMYKSTGTGVTCYFGSNSTTPFGIQATYLNAAPNGTGNEFLYCSDTGAQRAVIRSNGGIANYSANNVNLSDRREKTNFAPAKSYLDIICAIPVQTYNYIDQNLEEDDGLTLGVVAQDVQAVAPELVMESNWGTEEEPKMRLSIYQTDLQYALMKCIQEQQAIIQQLQADVAALKGTP